MIAPIKPKRLSVASVWYPTPDEGNGSPVVQGNLTIGGSMPKHDYRTVLEGMTMSFDPSGKSKDWIKGYTSTMQDWHDIVADEPDLSPNQLLDRLGSFWQIVLGSEETEESKRGALSFLADFGVQVKKLRQQNR